ncbi:MAG: DegT/DnrJ/EryC1/StrS family aminotransferase [Verrucomicrobiota bacterium]|nr:DegT/DnrJ/EryC1/StrS family aminotransferase [Verrucomicrobiota bacterium]
MNVPILDLKAQYKTIKSEIDKAVAEVFETQYFILGPKVLECEEAIAEYSQCLCGCGVSSGTDALLLALMTEGIGEGDEVITTPYTFFATAGSISRSGATPVFVDIDPVTYNIDPAKIEEKITSRTKAIMPVHLYGQMADMDPIMEIAEKNDLVVIEDAAQAIGSEYKGKRAGSIGHYGCFSFFPSKNLGGAGDGGMVVTNNEKSAEKLKIFRVHGSTENYKHKYVGGNFRLDALQAVVINVKLKSLEQWSEGRQKNAERYKQLFAEKGLLEDGLIALPETLSNRRHIFNQFIVRAKDRDALLAYLQEKGVGCAIYYPISLHEQECFADLDYKKGDFPESEKAADETLALPIFPESTDQQAEYVVEMIQEFYQ